MKLFKRLTFLFALMAVGGLAALWAGMRAIATRVLEDQTAPVRAKYVTDWTTHADAFERDLKTAAAWVPAGDAAPTDLGCHVPFAGDAPAVQQHRARCPKLDLPDGSALDALEALGGALLTTEGAPLISDDFSWLAALRGHTDWSAQVGTPLEFFDVDPSHGSTLDVPVVDARQVRGLVARRLLQGRQREVLGAATEDVTALGLALLSRPVLLDQLVGVSVLQQLATELAAGGQQALAPPADALEALRNSRVAAALLWHPWTPASARARFTALLPAPSRCAASGEAATHEELGAMLREYDAAYVDALRAARVQSPCTSDFTARLVAARADVPPEVARRLLRSTELFAGDELRTAVMWRAADASAYVRRAAVETYFTLSLAKPFPVSDARSIQ